MIKLTSPISVQLPNLGLFQFNSIELTEIDYTVSYDNSRKRAYALLKKVALPIVLWEGDDYDAIGQFTDADVENRIKELIGPDYAEGIKLMFCK